MSVRRHHLAGGAAAGVAAALACSLACGPALAAPAGSSGYTLTRVGTTVGAPVGIDAAGDVVATVRTRPDQFPTNTLFLAPYRREIALSAGPKDTGYNTAVVGISARGRSVGNYTAQTGSGDADLGVTWGLTGRPADVGGYANLPSGADPGVQLAAINDSGQLVGTANRPGHGQVATRWSATHVASPLYPQGSGVVGRAINDDAVVAGSLAGHAALFRPGNTVQALAPLAGETSSVAVGLDDSGEAIGSSTRGSVTTPVYWDSAGHVHRVTLPARATAATLTGINSSGEFSGWSSSPYGQTAVVWTSPTHPVALPVDTGDTYDAQATAINDAGVVTGWEVSTTSGDFAPILPVVWTPPSS